MPKPLFTPGQEVMLQCCPLCRPVGATILRSCGQGFAAWSHPGPDGRKINHSTEGRIYRIRHPVSGEEALLPEVALHPLPAHDAAAGTSFSDLMADLKSQGNA